MVVSQQFMLWESMLLQPLGEVNLKSKTFSENGKKLKNTNQSCFLDPAGLGWRGRKINDGNL